MPQILEQLYSENTLLYALKNTAAGKPLPFSMHMSEVQAPYTFQFLETATEVLRAVAHPHRLLIIEMLHQQKSMNVTEVYERLGIEQAVASHHLRILKDRGVVQVRRDGKNSIYSLTSDEYCKILEVLGKVV